MQIMLPRAEKRKKERRDKKGNIISISIH